MEYKNILVPVDGSPESHRAVEHAVYMATLCGAEITLMTVVDLNKVMAALDENSKKDFSPEELRKEGFKCLQDFMSEIPKELNITPIVKVGSPAETIIEQAVAGDMDLVIMGSRGLGPFETMVIGSVSNAVEQRCTVCPVMIVR